MSHITKMNIVVHDLDVLERAARNLGGTLNKTATSFEYFAGSRARCDASISFPGTKYEVGIIKSGDVNNPSYSLETDFWGTGQMAKKIGENGFQLGQQYAVELTRKHYESQGFMLEIQTKEDGGIDIIATR